MHGRECCRTDPARMVNLPTAQAPGSPGGSSRPRAVHRGKFVLLSAGGQLHPGHTQQWRANASPRKPSVWMLTRSSGVWILLVACRMKAVEMYSASNAGAVVADLDRLHTAGLNAHSDLAGTRVDGVSSGSRRQQTPDVQLPHRLRSARRCACQNAWITAMVVPSLVRLPERVSPFRRPVLHKPQEKEMTHQTQRSMF